MLLSLMAALPLHADLNIAEVRVDHIIQNYKRSIDASKLLQKKEEELVNHPRGQKLREESQTLLELSRTLKKGDYDLEQGERLQKEYEVKSAMYEALKRDSQELLDRMKEQIRTEHAENILTLAEEIRDMSHVVAEELGFALVFDTSGYTNSSAPFVLYIRDATDITEIVLKRLHEVDEESLNPIK